MTTLTTTRTYRVFRVTRWILVPSAWLAVVVTAGMLSSRVSTVEAAVVTPVVVAVVGAVLFPIARRGVGTIGVMLTTVATYALAATTWGEISGAVLIVATIAALLGLTHSR